MIDDLKTKSLDFDIFKDDDDLFKDEDLDFDTIGNLEDLEDCYECDGTGYFIYDHDDGEGQEYCYRCNGTGKIKSEEDY